MSAKPVKPAKVEITTTLTISPDAEDMLYELVLAGHSYATALTEIKKTGGIIHTDTTHNAIPSERID